MDAGGEQLALIVGHYKSGSTWLANLLCLHPDVRGLRETHVFRYSHQPDDPGFEKCIHELFSSVAWAEGGRGNLLRNRVAGWTRPVRTRLGLARGQATLSWTERPTTLLDLSLWHQRQLRKKLARCSSSEELCRCFFGFLLEKIRPRRYLLEKTPTNIDYVPTIQKIFPRAKLMAIHRDGRDFVVSDKYHLANTYNRSAEFSESVRKWREAMERHCEYTEKYGVFSLSYESLLERPKEVVPELLEFLELPTEPAVVEDMVERSSFKFVTGRSGGTEKKSDFYRKGVSGDWLNHFSEEEKARFSELAGDLLVKLGYEHSRDWREWLVPTS